MTRVEFIRPRQGYGYFAGDIASLPDEKVKKLLDEGYVRLSDTPEVIESDLPEDLPARQALIDAGLINKKDVLAAAETLTDVKGLGKSTAEKIVAQLS